ncbi:MAG: hypothetical protein COA66_08195 [Arcobacter sp.]|nr:MAG: hypothetical protein COA66_08195 [Arcobacter sp.]
MKDITGYFLEKNILFKKIEAINLKDFGTRKKIDIFTATSVKREFYAIFILAAKSRFIRKNADELMILCENLALYKEHNFKKKILLISSPLCSKSKKYLEENDWRIEIDFM